MFRDSLNEWMFAYQKYVCVLFVYLRLFVHSFNYRLSHQYETLSPMPILFIHSICLTCTRVRLSKSGSFIGVVATMHKTHSYMKKLYFQILISSKFASANQSKDLNLNLFRIHLNEKNTFFDNIKLIYAQS